ncbi:hypothetical protein LMG28688_01352 [Paraburkholderia caffeinitolerans]|uniref:Uncharacterized protein n=1 Tax=Paraburkholderia caffeinitolerans TaxID=1723730 RepID=A0A6J5FMX3_9BURK|nr:hypothetical protein LMG28688_01352 [Paraburkholderia caffeinitolerans]CAB3802376.1 hypothetical protein LMG28690_05556 [Paraburkholderia caffeinilytica]
MVRTPYLSGKPYHPAGLSPLGFPPMSQKMVSRPLGTEPQL